MSMISRAVLRCKRIPACAAIILVVVVLLVLFLALRRPIHVEESDYRTPKQSIVSLQDVHALLKSVAEDRSSALVRFSSDWISMRESAERRKPGAMRGFGLGAEFVKKDGDTFLRATHVATSVVNLHENRVYLRGRFEVLADLHRRFPRWGHVDDSVPLTLRWGSDKTLRRLMPLLQGKKPGESTDLIAINALESKAPREAEYIGPLKQADGKHVYEMMDLLKVEPFEKMSLGRANTLVASENPWLVWLGLARLADRNVLQPKHFEIALRCRAAAEFNDIYREMEFQNRLGDAFLNSLPAIALSDKTNPNMQKQVLQKLVTLYKAESDSGGREIDRHINLSRFQKDVRAYRPKAAADPERKQLVVYLNQILQLS